VNEMTDRSDAWERQPGEPNRWFARFEAYRLAGPARSLLGSVNGERSARGAAKSRSVPQAWATNAKRWQWRERAEAWDEFQRQEARVARAREVEEMNRRHVQEAKALQGKAVQRLKALDVELLSPAELLRYVTESAKLERTALGEPPANEEPRRAGSGGSSVLFTFEDAVRADQELEVFYHDRMQQTGGDALPDGNPQVP